jgi:Tol biopolymer transport system component
MRLPILFALLSLTAAAQQPRLENLKQLTFGGSNAEAYWSPDGTKLIFQSTRDPYKCDQILTMNSDGSDVTLVSTGKGRTTCGYFLPDGKSVLYASTHFAAEACPPPVDRSKGYVWGVYPEYKVYVADLKGKILRQIANSKGYDAEATVNFKTKRIIYTSAESGDLELYSMDLKGRNKRRITNAEGYDGGAVFSRDGQRVVWRANHPTDPEDLKRYRALLADGLTSPMRMELFIANADGSGMKQLTRNGCANFAPTFTPDGKSILFSSNLHNCGGRKFELYIMSAEGGEPRQITNLGGFTSFPEFSPDGRKLVMATDYKAAQRYEFNIFTADWVQ